MKSPTRQSRLTHSLLVALAFQLTWIVAAIIVGLSGGSVYTGLVLLVMPVLWVPAVLELATGKKIPDVIQYNYYLFITMSSILGSAFMVYGMIPYWDSLAHIYSGVLLSWLGLFAVQKIDVAAARIPRWFIVAVSLATPMAFAAVWEVCEYLSDMYLGTMTQHGLEDTIVDMGVAVIGAAVATILAVWLKIPKSVMPRSLLKTDH